MSKIGALESAEATELLTSTLNGYKMEVEDATHVVDGLAAVDISAATSVSELALALQKTANSARLAGLEFEETVGMIASVSEASRQAPEVVGTAFKSMFARMSNVKAGVDIDEYGESVSDVEKVLSKYGIDLRTTNQEFEDFGVILDQINEKWVQLSATGDTVAMSQIATALGMSRQQEYFKTLMENYDKAKEYEDIAINSQGFAEEKFDSWVNSIQGKLNTLQATWEGALYTEDTVDAFGILIEHAEPLVIVIAELINQLAILVKLLDNTGILDLITSEIYKFSDLSQRASDELSYITNGFIPIMKEGVDKAKLLNEEIETLDNTILDLESATFLTTEQSDELDQAKSKVESLREELESLQEEAAFVEGYTYTSLPSHLDTPDSVGMTGVSASMPGMTQVNPNKGQYGIATPGTPVDKIDMTTKEVISAMEEMSNQMILSGKVTSDYAHEVDNMAMYLEEYLSLAPDVEEQLSSYGYTVEQVRAYIENLIPSIKDVTDNTTGWNYEMYKSFTIIDSYHGAIGNLETAYQEMNSSQSISLDTVKALVSQYPQLRNAIEVVNGQYKISTNTLKELAEIEKQSAISQIESQMEIANAAIESARIRINAIGGIADATANLMRIEALAANTNMDVAISAWEEYNSIVGPAMDDLAQLELELAGLQGFNLDIGVGSGSSSSTNNAYDDFVNAQQDAIQNQIDALQDEKDATTEYYDEKIDAVQEMIDALDEEAEKEEWLLKIEQARKKLYEANNNTVRLYKKGIGWVYEKDSEAVSTAQKELEDLLKEYDVYQQKLELEQKIKNLEDSKDKALDIIDEEIERLGDLKDAWGDALNIDPLLGDYESMLDELGALEGLSYEERLAALNAFLEDFNLSLDGIGGAGGDAPQGNVPGSPDYWVSPDGVYPSDKLPGPGHPDYEFKGDRDNTITAWHPSEGYATGTTSAKRTALSMVGEEGPELRVVGQGEGIIPSGATKNLMSWSKIDPLAFIGSGNIRSSRTDGGGVSYQISVENLNLPQVRDANDFAEALMNGAMNIAIQSQGRRSL